MVNIKVPGNTSICSTVFLKPYVIYLFNFVTWICCKNCMTKSAINNKKISRSCSAVLKSYVYHLFIVNCYMYVVL